MTIPQLNNVSIAQFQAFLELAQCKFIDIKGGHEKWTRADLRRPIIFQTHIDPIPEFIVRNNLRSLGCSKSDYHAILNFKKAVKKTGNSYYIVEVSKK
jgi:hypothetical protein